jgi:hypothetical protein
LESVVIGIIAVLQGDGTEELSTAGGGDAEDTFTREPPAGELALYAYHLFFAHAQSLQGLVPSRPPRRTFTSLTRQH